MKHRALLIAAMFQSAALISSGRFIRAEIEHVPIDRLLTNLQQQLAANRQDVAILYRLARVHSMAFATNLPSVPVTKRDGDPHFYSYGSDAGVPKTVFLSETDEARAKARQHLTNAILYYERAIRLLPQGSNITAHRWLTIPIHLGFAWCLDQAGDREDAVQAYRDALRLAWRQEVDGEFSLKERASWSWDRLRAGQNPFARPKRGYIGPGVCYSEEIIRYLLKILDPKKDAKEIAQLRADQKSLQSMGRAVTPILVPLVSDVSFSNLVNPSADVLFDLDGSGESRRWGWITTNAAWLVFDRNFNGRVDSGLQMFGSVTFWVFWADGYDALSSLDDNTDGKLSGHELDQLSLWCDRNSNGVSESGEVVPVIRLQIVEIACRGQRDFSGMSFNPRGIVFQSGATRPSYDWIAPMTGSSLFDGHFTSR